jgi:hypothetical protein
MTDLKQAAHNKQVDNALRIAIEAAWDKLDDKPVQKPVACRFCHSKKGCWAWQCYHCGEIDDVQKPAAQPEQEPAVQKFVEHTVIAGALFDFMGYLTSRRERIVLSAADEASPAVDAISDFAKMRGLSLGDAQVLDWQDYTTPPASQRPWQGLTEDEKFEMAAAQYGWEDLLIAAEAKLKELNHG